MRLHVVVGYVLLTVLICVGVTPIVAQGDSDFDPEAEFTTTYTFENITFQYPDFMIASDHDYQITLAFDSGYRDYITIATPQAFIYYGIPNRTLEIAAQAVFDSFARAFSDDRPFDQANTRIAFAELTDVYAFTIEADNLSIFVYTFQMDGAIFAASLITQQMAFPAAVEVRVLERIIASMVIQTPDAEATPEATPFVEGIPTRTAPTVTADDAIVLAQPVILYDGAISLSIPETWFTDGEITVATSQSIRSAIQDLSQLADGDVVLQIIHPRRLGELRLFDITIHTVAEALVNQFPNTAIYAYDDLAYDAYVLFVQIPDVTDTPFFFLRQAGENPDDVVVVVGLTPDYDAVEALILAIVDSIQYTEE